MAEKPASTPQGFSEALAKLVSVPRAEMQRRLATAPPEKVDRRKKFKYVTTEAAAKQ